MSIIIIGIIMITIIVIIGTSRRGSAAWLELLLSKAPKGNGIGATAKNWVWF